MFITLTKTVCITGNLLGKRLGNGRLLLDDCVAVTIFRTSFDVLVHPGWSVVAELLQNGNGLPSHKWYRHVKGASSYKERTACDKHAVQC